MKALVTSDWVLRYVDELRAEFPSVEFVREVSADIEVVIGNVDDEVLETAQRLKWIQALSAGVEWLRHVPALADTDIMVTNARGAHAAHHRRACDRDAGVFLARRFDTLYRAQQERVWLQPAPTGDGRPFRPDHGRDRAGQHRPGDRATGARVRDEGDRRGRP